LAETRLGDGAHPALTSDSAARRRALSWLPPCSSSSPISAIEQACFCTASATTDRTSLERGELAGGVGDRAGRLGEDDRAGPVDARHSPGSMDADEAGALPLDRPRDQHVDHVPGPVTGAGAAGSRQAR